MGQRAAAGSSSKGLRVPKQQGKLLLECWLYDNRLVV
jgi:hypothetical protein